jgi:hypothetical protein
MLRPLRGRLVTAIVTAMLLAGARHAAAQSTTTTTAAVTTTTTTTLQPHPFSAATASCVRTAKTAQSACKRSGGTTCRTDFETAYSNCFAAGAGVSCAKKCVTKETSCFGALPTTKKNCRKACHKALVRDVRACRRIADGDTIWAGGDASCLSTAQANFDLCKFVCSEAARDCHTSLKFCVANCANL